MAQEPVATLQDPAPLADAIAVAADVASEAQAATPSPGSAKRRNRKKSRRQTSDATDATADEGCSQPLSPLDDGIANAADQVSQPSPVASVDLFGAEAADDLKTAEVCPDQVAVKQETETPKTVQEALKGLVLTSESEAQLTPAQDQAALMMQLRQSSGRLPSTPPPTPEPYLVHSPDTNFPRVAPVSSGLQMPPPPTDLSAEVAATGAALESTAEVSPAVQSSEVVEPSMSPIVETDVQETSSSATEETATRSGNEQSVEILGGQAVPMQVEVELVASEDDPSAEASPCKAPVQTQTQEAQLLQSSEDTTAELSVNGATTGIESSPVAKAAPLNTEEPTPENLPAAGIPTEAFSGLSVSGEDPPSVMSGEEVIPQESEVVEVPEPVEPSVEVSSLPSEPSAPTPEAHEEVPPPGFQDTKAKKEGSVSKRGREPETIPTAAITGKRPVGSNQAARACAVVRSAQSAQHTKRKSDNPSVLPPPAPIAAGVEESKPLATAPIRTRSGSKLTKPEADTITSDKPVTAVRRPSRGSRGESMMNPTASSAARATAAEGRRSLMKSAAPPKMANRKSLRSSITAGTSMGKLFGANISTKEKPVTAPVEDDTQRNVKRRFTAVDAAAASTRLYQDAKESKMRRDIRRAELEETYSFAPQVNPLKRHSTVEGKANTGEVNHFSRLHAQAKEMLEKKRELQHQHERDGCTFAPIITARAKRMSHTSSAPRYEDLYKQAQTIKQKREEKLLEMAKTAEEECPFKPQITTSKSPVKTRPLYDSEREKQKKLALEQKKIETEMIQCTFKPKVGVLKRPKPKAESTTTDSAPAGDTTFYDRLYQASIQRAERLEKLRQEQDQKEKSLTPFQPKITSSRSRAGKTQAKAKQPFHKRLYNKDYMQKLAAAREQRRLEGEQQFTFKITEAPIEIKEKAKERGESPGKNIFERLYGEKDKLKEKIEIGEELKMQKEMAECTFRPQIEVDAVPSSGEPTPPVWERLLSYDKAQVIEEREKLKEQLEMQDCTFKPEVKSPDSIPLRRSPSYNFSERLGGSPADSLGSFITRRPSSSPGKQTSDTKGVSIGQIIKSAKITLPTGRPPLTRTHSVSQPSSVSKPTLKRASSFVGPKSANTSPTPSGSMELVGSSRRAFGRDGNGSPLPASGVFEDVNALKDDEVNAGSSSNLENYDTWATNLETKTHNL